MMSFAKNTLNISLTLMAFLMSFYLFKDIRYTDDFDVYESFYYNFSETSGDIGYVFLEEIGKYFHLTFYQFYNFVVGLQLVLFICLYRKYKVNEVIGLFGTILILYVQMANQIRFFLALPLFLIAVNYLFCNKNFIFAAILLFVSCSFHNGIIALLSFIPLYYLVEYKHIKKSRILFLLAVIGLLGLYVYPILYENMVNSAERFERYNESVSRLVTLYYMVFPCSSLWIVYNTYKNINIYKCSNEVRLSYYLTFFVIIWMVVSFSGIQIINARYVNALFPMWLTCMLMPLRIKKENKYSGIIFFLAIAFLCKYVLPKLLFGISDIDKIIQIWLFKQ